MGNQRGSVNEKAFEKFGLTLQLVKAAEECSELSVGICKYVATRDIKHFSNIIEEMADIEIMIDQLKYSLGEELGRTDIYQAVESIKKGKLERVAFRVGVSHEKD